MDVSVIIVSWNTREMLRNCLRSIYEAAGTETFEMIVVDNASTDGSADMVSSCFPRAQLVRNEFNLGFAAANNQGMAIANGRYVLLLNSDTVVHPLAVQNTIAFADQHEDAAVIGCHVTGPKARTQFSCYRFPSLMNLALSLSQLAHLFPRNRFFGRYRLTWWTYDRPREVDAVAGCFMLVRKKAIEEVGGMSERYFMYSEDVDWCWRFRRRSWKTMFTPAGCIIHFGQASSSQCATEMHLLERRSLLMFLEMKSGRAARWLANSMFCVGSLARLPAAALQQLFGADKERAAARRRLYAAALRFHLFGRFPETLHGA